MVQHPFYCHPRQQTSGNVLSRIRQQKLVERKILQLQAKDQLHTAHTFLPKLLLILKHKILCSVDRLQTFIHNNLCKVSVYVMCLVGVSANDTRKTDHTAGVIQRHCGVPGVPEKD